MDLAQQVKNYYSTKGLSTSAQNKAVKESVDAETHQAALQTFVNGGAVDYQNTLRIVAVDGSRRPADRYAHIRRSPGFIRNATGGFYTS